MADKKVTALTDLGDNIASADLFHVVDDPSGTPINKKIAAEDVFNNIPSWLGLKQASQTRSKCKTVLLIAAASSSSLCIAAKVGIGSKSSPQRSCFLKIFCSFKS